MEQNNIRKAKDLVLQNWARWAIDEVRKEYLSSENEDYIYLVDNLYMGLYNTILMDEFNYEECVKSNYLGAMDNLIVFYHDQLRKDLYRLNEMLFVEYRFENSRYTKARLFVRGVEDTSEELESRLDGNPVFFKSDEYRINLYD